MDIEILTENIFEFIAKWMSDNKDLVLTYNTLGKSRGDILAIRDGLPQYLPIAVVHIKPQGDVYLNPVDFNIEILGDSRIPSLLTEMACFLGIILREGKHSGGIQKIVLPSLKNTTFPDFRDWINNYVRNHDNNVPIDSGCYIIKTPNWLANQGEITASWNGKNGRYTENAGLIIRFEYQQVGVNLLLSGSYNIHPTFAPYIQSLLVTLKNQWELREDEVQPDQSSEHGTPVSQNVQGDNNTQIIIQKVNGSQITFRDLKQKPMKRSRKQLKK